MVKLFSSKWRMELTWIRKSSSRRSYFYCIGGPTYQNPIYQRQAFVAKNEWSVKKPPPQCVMNVVKNTAARAINGQIAGHLKPIPEPSMNDAQIDCVPETIIAAINYTAATDLGRQP